MCILRSLFGSFGFEIAGRAFAMRLHHFLLICYLGLQLRFLIGLEVGLTGEIRAVNRASQRVTEAARLGFTKCIMPWHNLRGLDLPEGLDINVIGVRTIRDAVGALLPQG